jgi:hypothetical protein
MLRAKECGLGRVGTSFYTGQSVDRVFPVKGREAVFSFRSTLKRKSVKAWSPAAIENASASEISLERIVGVAENLWIFSFDCFGLGFRAACSDGDFHSIFHRIFEGHLDSE